MQHSSHASELSLRPHLSLASRHASTDSEDLPSTTSFHDAHTHPFLAIDRSSTSFHAVHAPTFFNINTAFTIATEADWLVMLTWSMHFPSHLQARRLRRNKRDASAVTSQGAPYKAPEMDTAFGTIIDNPTSHAAVNFSFSL